MIFFLNCLYIKKDNIIATNDIEKEIIQVCTSGIVE